MHRPKSTEMSTPNGDIFYKINKDGAEKNRTAQMKWRKMSILATIVASLSIVTFLGERRFVFTSRSSTAIGRPFLRHPIIDSQRTSTIFPSVYGSVDLVVEGTHRVLQEAGLPTTVPIPSVSSE